MWLYFGVFLFLGGCVAPRPSDQYFRAYDRASRLERQIHPEQAAAAYAEAAEIGGRRRLNDRLCFVKPDSSS